MNLIGDNPDVVIHILLASGKASYASVHGTNRPGADSLLDIIVFGRACANSVADLYRPGEKQRPLPGNA